MTKEEIMELDSEALELRFNEVKEAIETNAEGTDFEALSLELDSIKERKSFLAEEARKADIKAVIDEVETEPTTIEIPKEERKMTDVMEIRQSTEYVEAFAKYVKTGDDSECRALLTTNASGVVPVPTLVEDEIRTAWESDKIMERVRKAYVKGNLKVGFEISADGAVVHTEGAAAPSEETIVLGIVEIIPASIKKWISISDEVYDMKAEAFLRYIYDELTHQIAKKAADLLIQKINACGTVSTNTATTNVAVPVVANTGTLSAVADALGQLSEKASDPVVIMNRATFSTFKALQYAANFAVDPFEGLPVLYNNTIASFDAATTGVPYMIVGDLGEGALANYPAGDEITIKQDDLSLAEKDLIKFVGRQYVGVEVVSPNAFVKVVKELA